MFAYFSSNKGDWELRLRAHVLSLFRLQVFLGAETIVTNREFVRLGYGVWRGKGEGQALSWAHILSTNMNVWSYRRKLLNSLCLYWNQCRNLKNAFISILRLPSFHPLGIRSLGLLFHVFKNSAFKNWECGLWSQKCTCTLPFTFLADNFYGQRGVVVQQSKTSMFSNLYHWE